MEAELISRRNEKTLFPAGDFPVIGRTVDLRPPETGSLPEPVRSEGIQQRHPSRSTLAGFRERRHGSNPNGFFRPFYCSGFGLLGFHYSPVLRS